MSINELPIGVFDSGLGGLTAVRELKEILPHENIVYFGDTGRLPYGTRSAETIIKYACDDMNFLLTNSVKAVLIACGTVSSTALGVLKSSFDIPIFGVVEPASAEAVRLTEKGKIAVLATPSTISAKAFDKAIAAINPAFSVMGVGCPMFVPLVENGYIGEDCNITKEIVNEYLSKLEDFSPDVIILGCTHYPLIKNIISKAAGEKFGKVRIVDSGRASAHALKNFLHESGKAKADGPGVTRYFVSDEPHNFMRTASLFLGEQVENISKIDVEKYLYKK